MRVRAFAAPAAALAAYSLWEARAYRLRRHAVPVNGARGRLTVLHLSDAHLTARNRSLQQFLGRLADAGSAPDVAVVTGDMVDDESGIDPLVEALAGIPARLGRFYVLGSHDHYPSTLTGVAAGLRHLYAGPREPVEKLKLDTTRLQDGLETSGWTSLINRTHSLESALGPIRLTGLDDPVMRRHQVSIIGRAATDVLAIGLVHSPDVVSEWALAGYDLVLAGHTHGGQVRLPVVGALVTNCTLPAALAGGLHRIGRTWLHVSPGLGTSKFTPIRFLCPPEATLLELHPA